MDPQFITCFLFFDNYPQFITISTELSQTVQSKTEYTWEYTKYNTVSETSSTVFSRPIRISPNLSDRTPI